MTWAALAGVVIAFWDRFAGTVNRRYVWVLVLGGLGTFIGIAAGGRIFGHYLMQLIPFSVPFVALAVAWVGRRYRGLSWLALALMALWWGEPLARKYLHHARRLERGEPLWNDPATQLVRYLDQAGARGRPLFLLDAHIGYWLLDSPVPTRVGHPSNLGRTAMTRMIEGSDWHACGEFDSIFARGPWYVVVPEDRSTLGLDRKAERCLNEHLAAGYQRHETIDRLVVYRRQPQP
jgi:hypothetical protein